MRVLVTGCAGFIGWKVSELLLQNEHTVIGIDNLNSTYDVRLKRWRLSQLEPKSGFAFHHADITDLGAIAGVVHKGGFDGVINLAARAGVRQSLDDPWEYYQTNLIGTLNLLESCRQEGVSKFVLSSTSSVYGEGRRPFTEDGPTDSPLSPYAASKKAAEVTCYTYHQLHGLDVTILRYFTVYGPAGRPDMSVFRFIKQIAEDEPLTLYGDGSQERDFTYVGDVARGTLAALKPMGFEVINLGSNRPVVLRQVIGLIEEALGKKARIDSSPRHPTDALATWARIDKAKRLLDWEPQVPFAEGLFQTIEWYKQNRDWVKGLA